MSKLDRSRTRARQLSSYVVAALSVGIATVITLALGPVIKHTATLFFCSVMLSSWYGGVWAGALAALLSVVALDYYFIPPLHALGISLQEAPDIIAFMATALFIGWLSGDQKRAQESLSQARDELDTKVQERTAELEKANEQLQSEIAEREAAQEGLIRAQAEIARIARITTVGELAASIAHELNQPLGSIVTTGDACLRWLAAKPPNLDEAQQAVEAIIRDATRASNVVVRTRKLLRRGDRLRESLEINDVINEVLGLLEVELRRNGISLRIEKQENLPPATVDRILLQQVLLNLIMNAMDAMRAVSDRMRVLSIRLEEQDSGSIIVIV